MSYLLYYFFKNIFYLIIAAFFVVVLLSISISFDLLSHFDFLVISSGSMKPALAIGDLVVVNGQPKQIQKNDIITFKDPHGSEFFITHRVVSVQYDNPNIFFQTKGDANKSIDDWHVEPKDVRGKVILAFPFVGYALEFAKTFSGFVILIIIPSVIVIVNELAKVKLLLNKIE